MLELLKHQADFVMSEARHSALIAGFGAGKTQGGVVKTTIKKLRYPGVPVAYYLPTYGLLEDIAFPRFSELLDSMNVQYDLKRGKYEFDTAYGRIIMRSLMNPERIVGYEVGYSLVDETDLLETDKMRTAFIKIISRNRLMLPNGDINQTDVVGTPEGFKWLYEFFVKQKKDDRVIIKGRTQDNPFLPDSYIEALSNSYSPQQLEAYMNGEFVNLNSGTVHYRFGRQKNHTDRVVRPGDTLHIGMDFNVGAMSAIVHVVDIENGKRVRKAVDEIIDMYDTPQMAKVIAERYPNYNIIIYPDASGDNRKSSGNSDIDILKQFKFVVRKLSKNPFVKDRVNAMNLAFEDVKGSITYYVNTDKCPNYTEALEQQVYKNGEPDKSSGHDHKNEAGGYFIYYDTKHGIQTWGRSSLT
ncbi:terminase family protein [Flavobacterium sp.]|uniref:phage terminase large subunit family protein n=1 Tax=Flavobacterium sp. TaxID=239 RepID=UPI003458EC38